MATDVDHLHARQPGRVDDLYRLVLLCCEPGAQGLVAFDQMVQSPFEGSSVDGAMIDRVHEFARDFERVLVILDSNHTHEHVLAELRAYAPLVAEGSYCIVLDTIVEDLPSDVFPDRPWGPGNSPRSAIQEFLLDATEFEQDRSIDSKLLITCAPGGFLRRTP